MFKAVPYNEKQHYKIAARWWKEHKWPSPPDTWELPPTGVVILCEDNPVAMTWIHRGDGPACWVTWFIADRYVDRKIRSRAIDLLIDTCEDLIKGLGYKQVFTVVKLKKLLDRFEKKQYRLSESDMTVVLKELKHGT